MRALKPLSATAPDLTAAERILDVAEVLGQTRGFNGFSYADIAAQLGVTKASLHYHFPSKSDLGRALVERYHRNFAAALAAIDRTVKVPRDKLQRYAGLYDSVLRNDRMCLCGMLAAEYATLPAAMQAELIEFFNTNEVWLSRVLAAGREGGDFSFRGAPKARAQSLLGALEGALLVARAYRDERRFRASAKQLLSDL
jgi:TetR/AcrR family transcriptional regulator, transcriptional repressor for nem operon